MAVLVSNDRLIPNHLDPNSVFAIPSNHVENRSPVTEYKKAVQMVLENPADKADLTKALEEFRKSMVVEELIDKLKVVLDAPHKRILYKYISPLIPVRLKAEYKSLVPHIPGFQKKMIRLKQVGNQPFGFTVRGGKEYDCGIYVVKVQPSSRAAQSGLKPGDQIVRVNGLTLSQTTHKEFVELIKLRKSLALAVKSVGLIPEIKQGSRRVTWKGVGEPRTWITKTRIGIHGPIRSTKRIQVILQGGESLGANVKISRAIDAGVLIVDVTRNSPAFIAGLKPGDEILEVNGRSLIGISHDRAITVLRSSNTLMMTIRADRVMSRDSTVLSGFDFTTREHDTDEVLLSSAGGRYLSNETFVLREREQHQPGAGMMRQDRSALRKESTSANRISVLDTEVQQSRVAPVIASPAAFGHGPTLAMPTLVGMGQDMKNTGTESVDYSTDVDFSLSMSGGIGRGKSSGGGGARQENNRDSIQSQSNSRPVSGIHPVNVPVPPRIGEASVSGDLASQTKQTKVSTTKSIQSHQQDLSSFQFPVDDDDESTSNGQRSRNTRSTSTTNGRRPKFSDCIEIIPDHTVTGVTSPRNYTFSNEILKGRKVVTHVIPKNGPLRLAIRGGSDTPLGDQIIISRIIENGAAAQYGKLNVGDQILMIDGTSLINVTHDEAGQAFKQAMETNIPCIELIVAEVQLA